MSEAEIIHDAEIIGTELEPVQHGTLFRTDDPSVMLQRASAMANALKELIVARKLSKRIGDKDHVLFEGWTTLGSMLGVFAVTEWTRQIDGGWEARVEARTLTGQVVGAAEAVCTRSERLWKDRDEYALKSMAQTRAASKALRMPLGFVMQLAGFDPTPAEEMPRDGGASAPAEKQNVDRKAGVKVPTSWAKLTELVSAYDQHVHDTFFAFMDAARRYLFPASTDTKSLAKADKDALFQTAARAGVLLREAWEPSEMPYPDVEDLRAIFAEVCDGVELEIPGEALDAEAAEAAARES